MKEQGRRDYYVYAHRAGDGTIFYVGKGTGRRAWSNERHPVWQRYVAERLDGEYSVEILEQDLTEEEAEERECAFIRQHGTSLVNWVNPGRAFDYAAIEEFHKLRGENRLFLAETLLLEDADPQTAAERYMKALDNLRVYEGLVLEKGLVAELSNWPKCGEVRILHRLTECLIRLGRVAEAQRVADQYFAEFPGASEQGLGKRVLNRLQDLSARVPTSSRQNPRRSRRASSKRGQMLEKPLDTNIQVPGNQVERNLSGHNLERRGLVENAIAFYEANVQDGFEGNFPYERLAAIYRRRGRLEDEIRVLQRAVEVFSLLHKSSPRTDVPLKLAAFIERLHVAKSSTE